MSHSHFSINQFTQPAFCLVPRRVCLLWVERRVGNRSVDGGWKRRDRKREEAEVLLREDVGVRDLALSHVA